MNLFIKFFHTLFRNVIAFVKTQASTITSHFIEVDKVNVNGNIDNVLSWIIPSYPFTLSSPTYKWQHILGIAYVDVDVDEHEMNMNFGFLLNIAKWVVRTDIS